jgi:hypothetical protein
MTGPGTLIEYAELLLAAADLARRVPGGEVQDRYEAFGWVAVTWDDPNIGFGSITLDPNRGHRTVLFGTPREALASLLDTLTAANP